MAESPFKARFSWALLHPKYWFLWLAMGMLWLTVQLLPLKVLMTFGKWLGLAFYRYAKERVNVARINIALCFPELSQDEVEALVKKHMISLGRGLFDSAIAWFWPYWRLKRVIEVEGLEHLTDLHAEGGVLFLGYHFTSLEFISPGINRRYPEDIVGVYRPHSNKVMDFIQTNGRERHSEEFRAIPKQDVRGMVKCLRNQQVLSYLPDQDFGEKYSVFAPFFRGTNCHAYSTQPIDSFE